VKDFRSGSFSPFFPVKMKNKINKITGKKKGIPNNFQRFLFLKIHSHKMMRKQKTKDNLKINLR
jgi:hypothetical protein